MSCCNRSVSPGGHRRFGCARAAVVSAGVTGLLKWSYNVVTGIGPSSGSIIGSDGVVYLSAGTKIYAFGPTVSPSPTTSPTPTTSPLCNSGSYCPGGSLVDAQPCAPGYYCPRNSFTPTACSNGTYNPNVGSVDASACVSCPAGRFGNTTALPSSNCTDVCPAGFYCPGACAFTLAFTVHPFAADLWSHVC